MRQWLEEHAAGAMIASRFIPGTRLPLYICAGLVGMPLASFTAWASIAVLLWTPALVWLAAGAGGAALSLLPVERRLWMDLTHRIRGPAMFVLLKAARPLVSSLRSRPIPARLARWSRWEFWPMWLFYAPVAIWVGLLALRHRGISTITASNPGIPDGGVVGESKFGILSKLPSDCTIPSAFVEAGLRRTA